MGARERKRKEKKREEKHPLPKLLALVRRQLRRAGTHDGIGWRDVDLLGPVTRGRLVVSYHCFTLPSLPLPIATQSFEHGSDLVPVLSRTASLVLNSGFCVAS